MEDGSLEEGTDRRNYPSRRYLLSQPVNIFFPCRRRWKRTQGWPIKDGQNPRVRRHL